MIFLVLNFVFCAQMNDPRNWNRLVWCSGLCLSCCHLSFHLVGEPRLSVTVSGKWKCGKVGKLLARWDYELYLQVRLVIGLIVRI